jgi:ribosomal protein S18 acetylase RimI-like enzyme
VKTAFLHSKQEIAAFLCRSPWLNLYAIGDLDDFFWPYTQWYALLKDRDIRQIALLYGGMSLPVVLGITDNPAEMRDLFGSVLHMLPRRVYAHLSEGLSDVFDSAYNVEPHGTYYKFALKDYSRLDSVDTSDAIQLTSGDQPELEALYAASYPGNWFDPRMLETGQYFGVRRGGVLVCVAGIHVYSPEYRVAALGNVTTHPQFRGQGLATKAAAALCQSLRKTVDHIGLNVSVHNAAAIACYERLGFEQVATYEEHMLELKPGS